MDDEVAAEDRQPGVTAVEADVADAVGVHHHVADGVRLPVGHAEPVGVRAEGGLGLRDRDGDRGAVRPAAPAGVAADTSAPATTVAAVAAARVGGMRIVLLG
ncbi:hypothetical protein GCM10025734_78010 [Kitasatospora paranensis]